MRWAAGDTFSGEVLTRLQALGAMVELNPSSSGESSYAMPITAYPHLTGEKLEEFTRVIAEDEKTRPNINFVAQYHDEGEIKVLYFVMGHHDRVLRQYKEFFGMENLSDIEIVDNYIHSTETDKLIGGHMLVDAARRIVSIIIPLNFNRMTPIEVKQIVDTILSEVPPKLIAPIIGIKDNHAKDPRYQMIILPNRESVLRELVPEGNGEARLMQS